MRNPRIIIENIIFKLEKFVLPENISPTDTMKANPPARPSKPSKRFIALKIPTNHIRKKIKSIMGST